MELIRIEDGTPLLDADVSHRIAECESLLKNLKRIKEQLHKDILDEMEEKGIISIDTPELSITYVPEYDREKFETKKFKSDNPDLYDDYVSMISVKSSVRIKAKGEQK